jgi:hypothetical protein
VSGWRGRFYERKFLPALVVIALGVSGCLFLTVDPSPSLTLVQGNAQLELYNRGSSDLRIWAVTLDGAAPEVEEPGRIVPPDGFYRIRTDGLRLAMLSAAGRGRIEKRVALDVQLSDSASRSYLASFALLVKMTSGAMTIRVERQSLRLAGAYRTAGQSPAPSVPALSCGARVPDQRRIARMIASVIDAVLALPPRSGVTARRVRTMVSTAARILAARAA